MIRVLVDNSIYRYSSVDDVVVRPQVVNIGGCATTIRLARTERRAFRDSWMVDQIPAIQQVGGLARKRAISLCTSDELRWEFWQSFESVHTAQTGNESFLGVEFEDLRSPICRSRFQSLSDREMVSKKERIGFVQWLRDFGPAIQDHLDVHGWPQFEQESLTQIDRLLQLCGRLPANDPKLTDILHLWTAERSDVPFFMTLDKRFNNYITQTLKIELVTLPVTPSELLEKIGYEPAGATT